MSHILVITNNLKQAAFRLRVESLIPALARRGINLKIQVRPRSLLERRALLRSAADYDAVLIQRKLLTPSDIGLLKKNVKKIFYDVDDAVMHHSKPVGALERWTTRRRFLATVKNVDQVVAGSEHLAETFRRQGASAIVLPTTVDPDHYQLKAHSPTDLPALVWIGSKSTLPYLKSIHVALKKAVERAPGLRLITIADEEWEDPPIPAEHIDWSIDTEAAALVRGDIGIAPTPENPWTLGKCGFKIVQYMAAGLPVIASPVGANRDLVVNGLTGILPATEAAWTEAIVRLANDPSLRAQMGAAGRRRAVENYTVERAAYVWAKLLGSSDQEPIR